MHPCDGLFSGRDTIDAVGLAYGVFGLFGQCAWLPVVTVLDQWDIILSTVVTRPYEDRFALACDEDISFFVYCDPILGENGLVPASDVLPTLKRECGTSSNVSVLVFF